MICHGQQFFWTCTSLFHLKKHSSIGNTEALGCVDRTICVSNNGSYENSFFSYFYK